VERHDGKLGTQKFALGVRALRTASSSGRLRLATCSCPLGSSQSFGYTGMFSSMLQYCSENTKVNIDFLNIGVVPIRTDILNILKAVPIHLEIGQNQLSHLHVQYATFQR